MEDLQIVETVVRKNPKVIEQCGIIGIPPEDMHKVYCDRKFCVPYSMTQRKLMARTHSLDDRLR